MAAQRKKKENCVLQVPCIAKKTSKMGCGFETGQLTTETAGYIVYLFCIFLFFLYKHCFIIFHTRQNVSIVFQVVCWHVDRGPGTKRFMRDTWNVGLMRM